MNKTGIKNRIVMKKVVNKNNPSFWTLHSNKNKDGFILYLENSMFEMFETMGETVPFEWKLKAAGIYEEFNNKLRELDAKQVIDEFYANFGYHPKPPKKKIVIYEEGFKNLGRKSVHFNKNSRYI